MFCLNIFIWRLLITEVSCGDPGSVPSASKSGGYNYNDRVTYTCLAGYTLIGNNIIRCQADKNWSRSPPVCDSMYTFLCTYNKFNLYFNQYKQLTVCFMQGYPAGFLVMYQMLLISGVINMEILWCTLVTMDTKEHLEVHLWFVILIEPGMEPD